MSRIKEALQGKKAFIGFITAGDPSLEKTEEFVLAMERAGATLIEIGIPFSDPIAEGVVIQAANVRALQAGCTTDKVFDMVKSLRKKTKIPLVFLTYLNPIFKYGTDRFLQKCKEVSIDGLIIPDMPYEEKEEVSPYAKKYGIDLITLIAPTSKQRIAMLAKDAEGFIYVVSSMGVTGVRKSITTDLSSIVEQIRAVSDTPVAIGFGIHDREQVQEYFQVADGVIIGSAIVKIVEEYKDAASDKIYEYVKGLL